MDRSWQTQDMVWVHGSLCQLDKIPFNPALVTQQHLPPHSEANFSEAANAVGVKVGRCDTSRRKPSDLTFPFVTFLRESTLGSRVVANTSNIRLASSMAYPDFRFFEPSVQLTRAMGELAKGAKPRTSDKP